MRPSHRRLVNYGRGARSNRRAAADVADFDGDRLVPFDGIGVGADDRKPVVEVRNLVGRRDGARSSEIALRKAEPSPRLDRPTSPPRSPNGFSRPP